MTSNTMPQKNPSCHFEKTRDPVIRVEGLYKRYNLDYGLLNLVRGTVRAVGRLFKPTGDGCVLKDMTFSVPEGAVVGFLGSNGSGKTTTMKTILRLLFQERGRIEVFGRPAGKSLDILSASATGAMLDRPPVYDYLTAHENLEATAFLCGCRRPGLTGELLSKVGLSSSADKKVAAFSTGMRQRLGIAAALVRSPGLLFLDEPTNGLDPRGQSEVREIIRSIAREGGTTVFLSSHLLHEVEQICDFVIIIHEGRAVISGKVSELLGRDTETFEVTLSGGAELPRNFDGEGRCRSVKPAGPGSYTIVTSRGDGAALLRILVQSGLPVEAFVPVKASLEELYLKTVPPSSPEKER